MAAPSLVRGPTTLTPGAVRSVLTFPPGAPSLLAANTKYRRTGVIRAPDAAELQVTDSASASAQLHVENYQTRAKGREIMMLPMEKPVESLSNSRRSFPDFEREVRDGVPASESNCARGRARNAGDDVISKHFRVLA